MNAAYARLGPVKNGAVLKVDWNKKDENMKSSHDKDPRSVSSLSVLEHTKESTKLAFNDNDGDKEEEDPLRRRSRRRTVKKKLTNDSCLLSRLSHGTHRRIVNLFWVNLLS